MCDDGPDNSDSEPDTCRTNCRYSSCGDGVVDMVEECDEGLNNSNTEPDGCRFWCDFFDFDRCYCVWAYCGDGVKDTGEECDGRDLGGLDCVDHGFSGGELACDKTCTFLTTGCTP